LLDPEEAQHMLMLRPSRSGGFSMIELLITITVLGIVLALGLPNVSAWLQNTQIRNSAEAMSAGLQLARAEALRRNRQVHFYIVDSLDASCSQATAGGNWVVSLVDPSGKCDVAPNDTVDPFIIQKRSGQEGTPNAAVTASASNIIFNGLGNATGNLQLSVSNPTGGACQSAAGPMRCLQVNVNSSGSVRMCDPAVTDATDPRRC
jgi:type IV fimbrial biogenesis protein FimT